MPEKKAIPTEPSGLVRLTPVPGVFINGEPAVEREVTLEEAERLLRYKPPAYTRTPPPKPKTQE